jgi:hypothetical protein
MLLGAALQLRGMGAMAVADIRQKRCPALPLNLALECLREPPIVPQRSGVRGVKPQGRLEGSQRLGGGPPGLNLGVEPSEILGDLRPNGVVCRRTWRLLQCGGFSKRNGWHGGQGSSNKLSTARIHH